MGKKKTTDQRILLMTDSASDISDADLLEGGIVMLPFPIAIDGKGYLERVDFTTREFLRAADGGKGAARDEPHPVDHLPAGVP